MTLVIDMKLEVPGEQENDARHFVTALHSWCESHPGWRVVEFEIDGSVTPLHCPECGSPMEWEPRLQTHVCHHADE